MKIVKSFIIEIVGYLDTDFCQSIIFLIYRIRVAGGHLHRV